MTPGILTTPAPYGVTRVLGASLNNTNMTNYAHREGDSR